MSAIEELMCEMGHDGKNTLLLIHDLSSAVAYYRRLLERLELDTLTGLPGSNKYLDFKAGIEKRAPNLGVISFDLNDLKYYNDNCGHQAGDRLLQKAAESFHAITNRNVEVFRTGGDEFVGVIWNCAEGDIGGIIDKWQEKLAALNGLDDGVYCTIAWGAAFASGNYKYDEVFALADQRMYDEKRRMKDSGLKLGAIRR